MLFANLSVCDSLLTFHCFQKNNTPLPKIRLPKEKHTPDAMIVTHAGAAVKREAPPATTAVKHLAP